eukprot:tig00020964_g16806.t1
MGSEVSTLPVVLSTQQLLVHFFSLQRFAFHTELKSCSLAAATLVVIPQRAAVNASISLVAVREAGSALLATTDVASLSLSSASSSASFAAASAVNVSGSTGDNVVFVVTAPFVGTNVSATAAYNATISGGQLGGSAAVTVVSAALSCPRNRTVVNGWVECRVDPVGASPALLVGDVTVSVSPADAWTVSTVVLRAGVLFFNITPQSAVALSELSVRYSSALDRTTRHVASSPLNVTVVAASVNCTGLRRRVGANATCDVRKSATSADLRAMDVVSVASAYGTYTAFQALAGGHLTFSFVATSVTTDNGAPISVQWADAINVNASAAVVGPVQTIVIVNATGNCTTRLALGSRLVCTAVTPSSGASLEPSDFAVPVAVGASVNALVSSSGWLRYNASTSSGVAASSSAVYARDVALSFVAAATVPSASMEIWWSAAVGGGRLSAGSFIVIGSNLTCDLWMRRAINAPIGCRVLPFSTSPALQVADFVSPWTLPAFPGTITALALNATSNGVGFTLQTSLPAQIGLYVNYSASVDVDGSARLVPGSPTTLTFIAANLTVPASFSRVAVNASFNLVAVREAGSALLATTDVASLSLSSASSSASFAAASAVNVSGSTGDNVVFVVTAPFVGTNVSATAAYNATIGGGQLGGSAAVTVVSAALSCPRNRTVVNGWVECRVDPVGASPALLVGDVTVSVSPADAWTVSTVVLRAGVLFFNITPQSAVALSELSVRYSSALDRTTRHVASSPLNVTVAAASVNCTGLRRRVGANATCDVRKSATSADLRATDVVSVASAYGTYTAFQALAGGHLTFSFVATAVTTDNGAPISVQWADAINVNASAAVVGPVQTIVIVNATGNCTTRLALGSRLVCTAVTPSSGASLEPSDFAVPVAVGASVNALVSSSGWLRYNASTSSGVAASSSAVYARDVALSFVAAATVPSASMEIWWSAAVGGGRLSAGSFIVIGSNLTCDLWMRRAINAPIGCRVLPFSTSPALQVADFVSPWTLPAFPGTITALALNATSNGVGFTLQTSLPAQIGLYVNYSASVDVDGSARLVPGSPTTLTFIAANLTVPASFSRVAVNASFNLVAVREAGSALLATTDVASLSLSSASSSASFAAASAVNVSGSTGDNVVFVVTAPFVGTNVSATAAYNATIGGGQLGGSVAVTVVSAALSCPRNRTVVNGWVECRVDPVGASPALLVGDVTVSVSPADAWTVSTVVLRAGVLFFNITPQSAVALSELSVRYSSVLDRTTRHVASSPLNVTVVAASVNCTGLRRRVGANATCDVRKSVTSADLRTTDVVSVASAHGTYTAFQALAGGHLTFSFVATAVTTDNGAPISLQWADAINANASVRLVGPVQTIVIVNATGNCTTRLALGSQLVCTAVTPSSGASLEPGDFAVPVAVGASVNALVSSSGWLRYNASTSSGVAASSSAVYARDVALSFVAAATVPSASMEIWWSAAVGGGRLSAGSFIVIGSNLTCDLWMRRAINAPIGCRVLPFSTSPALQVADFVSPWTLPAFPGTITALALNATSNGVGFTLQTSLPAQIGLYVNYSASVDVDGSARLVPGSPTTLTFIAANLTVPASFSRVAVNASFNLVAVREAGSALLATTDVASLSLSSASSSASFAAASAVNVSGSTGDNVVFVVSAPFGGLNVSATAAYNTTIGGGQLGGSAAVTVVSAALSCPRIRMVVNGWVECRVDPVGASPALLVGDVTVSVSPADAWTVSTVVLRAGVLFFNITPQSAVALSELSVRYSSALDRTTRHVASSPLNVTVVAASVNCTGLRRRVGANATCDVRKSVTSADLRTTDVVSVASAYGTYTAFQALAGGHLTFSFVATAVTTDSGAPISLQWADAINANVSVAVVGPVQTIVIVNATGNCTTWLALGSRLVCTAVTPSSGASLEPSDFAVPVAVGASVNALVSSSGWLRYNASTSSEVAASSSAVYARDVALSFVAAATVPSASMEIWWSAAVGGGRLSAGSFIVIGSNLTCDLWMRRAINAPIGCRVLPFSTSPALQVADFVSPWTLPAFPGTITALALNATSNGVGFTLQTSLPAQIGLYVNYSASVDVDGSARLVPGSPTTLTFIAANLTVPASFSRVAVNASFNLVAVREAGSALLATTDVASLSLSSALSSASFAAASAVNVSGSTGDNVVFVVSAPFGGLNVSATAAYNTTIGGGQLGGSAAVTVVSAALSCPRIRMVVNGWVECRVDPVGASPALLVGDVTVSMAPAGSWMISAIVSRAGSLYFNITQESADAVSELSVRYSSALDGTMQHVAASPVSVTVVAASVNCTGLRRRVGANATCEVRKSETSDDLRVSDVVSVASAHGTYTAFQALAGGHLTFSFVATAVTTDNGAPISVQWADAINTDPSVAVVGPVQTIVIVNATGNCTTRLTLGSRLKCSVYAVSGGASLAEGDLGVPVAAASPLGALQAFSGWLPIGALDQLSGFESSFTAGVSAFSDTLAIPWSDAVGGGELLQSPVSVVSGALSCSPRRALGAPQICQIVPDASGPSLLVEDFVSPWMVPTLEGTVATLSADPTTRGVQFVLQATAAVAVTINVNYSSSLDTGGATWIVSGSPFAVTFVVADFWCNITRRSLCSPVQCFVGAPNGSVPLQLTDFAAPLTAPASLGTFSALRTSAPFEGYDSVLGFEWTPTALSPDPVLLSIPYSDILASPLTILPSDPVPAVLVGNEIVCASKVLYGGASMACWALASPQSALLTKTDFLAPALVSTHVLPPLSISNLTRANSTAFSFNVTAIWPAAAARVSVPLAPSVYEPAAGCTAFTPAVFSIEVRATESIFYSIFPYLGPRVGGQVVTLFGEKFPPNNITIDVTVCDISTPKILFRNATQVRFLTPRAEGLGEACAIVLWSRGVVGDPDPGPGSILASVDNSYRYMPPIRTYLLIPAATAREEYTDVAVFDGTRIRMLLPIDPLELIVNITGRDLAKDKVVIAWNQTEGRPRTLALSKNDTVVTSSLVRNGVYGFCVYVEDPIAQESSESCVTMDVFYSPVLLTDIRITADYDDFLDNYQDVIFRRSLTQSVANSIGVESFRIGSILAFRGSVVLRVNVSSSSIAEADGLKTLMDGFQPDVLVSFFPGSAVEVLNKTVLPRDGNVMPKSRLAVRPPFYFAVDGRLAIRGPVSSLDGLDSTDEDGFVIGFRWRVDSSTNTADLALGRCPLTTAQLNTTQQFGICSFPVLAKGVCVFSLIVSDDSGGLSNVSSVAILLDPVIVRQNTSSTELAPTPLPNVPPTISGLAEMYIIAVNATNTTALNETRFLTTVAFFADSDGYIASAVWRQMSGPSTVRFRQGRNTTATWALMTLVGGGEWLFNLTVTDDRGGTANATTTVAVGDPLYRRKKTILLQESVSPEMAQQAAQVVSALIVAAIAHSIVTGVLKSIAAGVSSSVASGVAASAATAAGAAGATAGAAGATAGAAGATAGAAGATASGGAAGATSATAGTAGTTGTASSTEAATSATAGSGSADNTQDKQEEPTMTAAQYVAGGTAAAVAAGVAGTLLRARQVQLLGQLPVQEAQRLARPRVLQGRLAVPQAQLQAQLAALEQRELLALLAPLAVLPGRPAAPRGRLAAQAGRRAPLEARAAPPVAPRAQPAVQAAPQEARARLEAPQGGRRRSWRRRGRWRRGWRCGRRWRSGRGAAGGAEAQRAVPEAQRAVPAALRAARAVRVVQRVVLAAQAAQRVVLAAQAAQRAEQAVPVVQREARAAPAAREARVAPAAPAAPAVPAVQAAAERAAATVTSANQNKKEEEQEEQNEDERRKKEEEEKKQKEEEEKKKNPPRECSNNSSSLALLNHAQALCIVGALASTKVPASFRVLTDGFAMFMLLFPGPGFNATPPGPQTRATATGKTAVVEEITEDRRRRLLEIIIDDPNPAPGVTPAPQASPAADFDKKDLFFSPLFYGTVLFCGLLIAHYVAHWLLVVKLKKMKRLAGKLAWPFPEIALFLGLFTAICTACSRMILSPENGWRSVALIILFVMFSVIALFSMILFFRIRRDRLLEFEEAPGFFRQMYDGMKRVIQKNRKRKEKWGHKAKGKKMRRFESIFIFFKGVHYYYRKFMFLLEKALLRGEWRVQEEKHGQRAVVFSEGYGALYEDYRSHMFLFLFAMLKLFRILVADVLLGALAPKRIQQDGADAGESVTAALEAQGQSSAMGDKGPLIQVTIMMVINAVLLSLLAFGRPHISRQVGFMETVTTMTEFLLLLGVWMLELGVQFDSATYFFAVAMMGMGILLLEQAIKMIETIIGLLTKIDKIGSAAVKAKDKGKALKGKLRDMRRRRRLRKAGKLDGKDGEDDGEEDGSSATDECSLASDLSDLDFYEIGPRATAARWRRCEHRLHVSLECTPRPSAKVPGTLDCVAFAEVVEREEKKKEKEKDGQDGAPAAAEPEASKPGPWTPVLRATWTAEALSVEQACVDALLGAARRCPPYVKRVVVRCTAALAGGKQRAVEDVEAMLARSERWDEWEARAFRFREVVFEGGAGAGAAAEVEVVDERDVSVRIERGRSANRDRAPVVAVHLIGDSSVGSYASSAASASVPPRRPPPPPPPPPPAGPTHPAAWPSRRPRRRAGGPRSGSTTPTCPSTGPPRPPRRLARPGAGPARRPAAPGARAAAGASDSVSPRRAAVASPNRPPAGARSPGPVPGSPRRATAAAPGRAPRMQPLASDAAESVLRYAYAAKPRPTVNLLSLNNDFDAEPSNVVTVSLDDASSAAGSGSGFAAGAGASSRPTSQ